MVLIGTKTNRNDINIPLASSSKRALVLILSYENEFNLHVKEISFSYERMSTKTRFEEDAKGNSEMAYCLPRQCLPFAGLL